MLKQSLIQEKLSDLAVASSAGAQGSSNSSSSNNNGNSSKSAKTTSSKDIGLVTLSKSGLGTVAMNKADAKSEMNSDLLLPHMPQWPRVQMGTQQIQSNIKNTNNNNHRLAINSNIGRDFAVTTSASSPTSSTYINSHNNRRDKINYSPHNGSNTNPNNNEDYTDSNEVNNVTSVSNENIEYDGIETVNYYSSKHYGFNSNDTNNNNNNNSNNSNNNNNNSDHFNSNSFNNGHGNSNSNNNNNNFSNNNRHNNSSNNFNQKSHLSFSSNATNSNNNNVNSNGLNQSTDNYDPTMKLRYLEKSIKFIQQQHNETLTCLHQEIESLKNENRGKKGRSFLEFCMAAKII